MSSLPDSASPGSFSFSQTLAAFFRCDGLAFSSVLDATLIENTFRRHHCLFGRTYTTAIVLWAFMSQVLRDGKEASCQSAVGRISSYLALNGAGDVDPDTRDYCRARAKLSEEALHELTSEIATQAEQEVAPEQLFKGRHAKLIDGSTFMMPDTPKNQKAYPQNPAQKEGIGFPIARFVVVMSLATACVIDAAFGKYKGKGTGETALLRQLLGQFSQGDLAVADRFYGNYWMIALLIAEGADVCFRKHQNRETDFRKGKRIGKNDHIIEWSRPPRPSWMSQEMYEQMPPTIRLREIRYTVTQPGRKQQPFVIITTLFSEDNKQEVTYDEIAELFGFRWNAELDIRSIKTHLNLNHLRCKSPAMVHREFWTTLLAYNAIRTTIAICASLTSVAMRNISFVSCCQFVLAAWDVALNLTTESLERLHLSRLRQISKCLVGMRPGRFEPRVIKKRGSNYNFMMQPRDGLKAKLEKGDNSFETK